MTILALLPILSLLVCLTLLKLSVPKTGFISLAIALVTALVFFGLSAFGLLVAIGKALSLALFVSLIVWGALLLHNIVSGFNAITVINKNFEIAVEDKFIQFIMMAWMFTGVLQSISGFGVPIVIVAPILIALGFDKVKSLAAALLGHSWAISFGSMGTAYFVTQMITGLPYEELARYMGIFNAITILVTGFGVCFIYDGFRGMKKGLPYVLPVAIIMIAVKLLIIPLGMYSLVSIVTALTGLLIMFLLYKLRFKTTTKKTLYASELTLGQAVLPYGILLGLAVALQFLPYALRSSISISHDFPATETALGFFVAYETGFARIGLFDHPVLPLLVACFAAILIYKKAGVWDLSIFKGIMKNTAKRALPATLSLALLVSMALIMLDSGMTYSLAINVASLTGRTYPLITPFIGVLGTFLTGNSLNAIVLLGGFHYAIAQQLGVSQAIMVTAYTVGSAVAVSISPTFILMGALASKLDGRESEIMRKLIFIVLVSALLTGVANFVMLEFLQLGS